MADQTDEEEIIFLIRSRIEPDGPVNWFDRALPEIRDVVITMAKADGIEHTVREVRQLFVAWLQQPAPRPMDGKEGAK